MEYQVNVLHRHPDVVAAEFDCAPETVTKWASKNLPEGENVHWAKSAHRSGRAKALSPEEEEQQVVEGALEDSNLAKSLFLTPFVKL